MTRKAVAKPARAARLLGNLLGSRDRQRASEGRPHIRCGLSWVTRRAGPASNPVVSFLIPLIAKEKAVHWSRVSKNMRATVQSFLNQKDDRWRAIICGQDQPDGLPEDPRVAFVKFDGKRKRFDKREKLHLAARALADIGHRDGYVMPFDADDIAHPDLVAYLLNDNNGDGYLVSRGIIADLGTSIAGRLGQDGCAHCPPFWRQCGSCAALRADLSWSPFGLTPFLMLQKHTEYHILARRFGLHLREIPFDAVMYVVNHGENDQLRHGKSKHDLIEKNPMSPEDWKEIRTEFGLDRQG